LIYAQVGPKAIRVAYNLHAVLRSKFHLFDTHNLRFLFDTFYCHIQYYVWAPFYPLIHVHHSIITMS